MTKSEITSPSRRTILKGAAAGAAGFVGVAPVTATPGDESDLGHIVGTSSVAATEAAKRKADSVENVIDFGQIGTAVVGRFPADALEALRKREDVRYVERDKPLSVDAQTLPCGVARIDADVSHDEGFTGTGADVAVVDTGIDSDHDDLQANLGTGKAWVGCSGLMCLESWGDDHGHGTSTAGIVGAVDNLSDVIGTAPTVTLHSAKVIDSSGSGTQSDTADALRWTADQGYDVASMSISWNSGTQTLKDACNYAYNNGVLLVGSTGNEGPCSDCVNYPAAYSEVIAVTAYDCDGTFEDYSSTGSKVELMGMANVTTTKDDGGTRSNFDGTSAACPHVSGTGALLMAEEYSNVDARQQLRDTAEDLGLSSSKQGHGLVDAEKAVRYIPAETLKYSFDENWETNSHSSIGGPVTIAKPISYNGSNPAHTRLKSVTSTDFTSKVEGWTYLDGTHTTETVSSLTTSARTGTTDDGTPTEAGTVTVTDTMSWSSVSFDQSFGTEPVVLTNAQTHNGGDPIVTRNRNVSTGGFDVTIQEEDAKGGHTDETAGYFAVGQGTGTLDGKSFEADTVTGVDDTWTTISFSQSYTDPVFLADMQTINGTNACNLRYRNLGSGSVEVFVEEETSDDSETGHNNETVGYVVVEGA
jgi:subtilisin